MRLCGRGPEDALLESILCAIDQSRATVPPLTNSTRRERERSLCSPSRPRRRGAATGKRSRARPAHR